MRKTKLLFLLCTFWMSHAVCADSVLPNEVLVEDTQDELAQIDRLIKATEENITLQKNIRALINEYRKVEKACFEKPNDATLLFKLAKTGKTVYEAIEESHLADYFRPEFMKGLSKLKQITD